MSPRRLRSGALPLEILCLIARHISSVEKLEVLLLLRRDRRAWDGSSVAAELRTGTESAAKRLEELAADGFVCRGDGGYLYDAATPLDADVERLAQLYRERRVAVITAIFSEPDDSLRSFSNAFRFKGKP